MPEITIPEDYKESLELLLQATDNFYIVGGFIRDSIIGIKQKDFDIDIAVNGKYINKIKELFEKNNYTINEDGFDRFGTITVYIKKGSSFIKLDIAQFRNEEYEDNSRKPIVGKESTIEKDLERRDFTINAMAYDYKNKKIIDLFNGKNDLNKKIIKAVKDPDERFKEDPLRILRGLRFAVKYNFKIENNTFAAMIRQAPRISIVSGERIRDEIIKGLSYNSVEYFKLLVDSGIMKELVKEFEDVKNIKHDDRHGHYNETLMQHILDLLEKKMI